MRIWKDLPSRMVPTMKKFAVLAVAFVFSIGGEISTSSAGADPPSFALTVVDSKGNIVGQLIGYDTVARQMDGVWLVLPVTSDGLDYSETGLNILFATSDCTGQGYVTANKFSTNGFDLPILAQLANGNIYYPVPPYAVMTLPYVQATSDGEPPRCLTNTGPAAFVGRAASVVGTSLGLVPPFSLKAHGSRSQ